MKRIPLILVLILTLLCCLPVVSASAAEEPTVCPDCGAGLEWFSVSYEGADAHIRWCSNSECRTFVGNSEKCTPAEGTATCALPPLCKVCGILMDMSQMPDPDKHDMSEVEYTWYFIEYDESGFGQYLAVARQRCNNCAEAYREVRVVATRTVTVQPTCTEGGRLTYTADFGEDWAGTVSNSDLADIPPTPHKAVTDEAVAPTCTETGLTEGSHCGVCGEVLLAQEVAPVTAHDMCDVECVWSFIGVDEDGIAQYRADARQWCNNCSTAYREATVMATWTVTVPPTCTEEGRLTYTADFEEDWVGTVSDSDLASLPMLGHDYEVTGTVRAACNKEGRITHTCTLCGDTYTETIPEISHYYDLWSPNGDGTHDAPCRRCSYVSTRKCTTFAAVSDDGETILSVCPVCGGAGEMTFDAVRSAKITSATGKRLPSGEAIVRGVSVPVDGVLYAFTTAYEYAGHVVDYGTRVDVSLPLSIEGPFALISVDPETNERASVPFTHEDGVLAFEARHAALYLIVAE